MNKKTLNLRLVDWWQHDTKENFYSNFIVKLLQESFNVVYASKPDFIIFGPYGDSHLEFDCVRVFFTGENVRADFNVADYAIDFDYMDFGDRHFRLFYPCMQGYLELQKGRVIESKSKFCGFIVSNPYRPYTDMRDFCFDKLNEYKKVDSGGAWKNNIGHRVSNKHEWLKDYKFNICFENSSYPGYLTEKLFDAFAAGCIPIYWGDTSLRLMDDNIAKSNGGGGVIASKDSKNLAINTKLPHINKNLLDYKINPKAFINAHNYPNLDSLINEIKRIDNDDKAYQEMIQEPIFLDNDNVLLHQREKLKAFLESIFNQEPKDAFRREGGQYIDRIQEQRKKVHDIKNLMRYYKIAKCMDKILSLRLLPRMILKKYKEKFKKH